MIIKTDKKALQKYLTYYYWAFSLLIRRVTATFMTLLGLIDYVEFLNGLLWLAVFILCFKVFTIKIKWRDVLLLFLLLLFSCFAKWIWPFNYFIDENRAHYFISVFPYLYIGKCINIDDETIRGMRNISMIVIILNYAVYFLYYMRGGGSGLFDDNLAFAYDLLPHVALLFYAAFTRKSFINMMWSFLSVMLLVMQGTRGPLLFLVVFYGWCFFFTQPIKKQITKTLIIVAFLALFLYSGMFENTILLLIKIGKNIGVSTRVLETIIEESGSALRSNFWRNYLFEIAKSGIKAKPYIGYGPYGDYYLTRNNVNFLGGIYIHNIVVELLCDYGIPMGILVFSIICIVLLKAYRAANKNKNSKMFLVVLISSGLFKLFFSSSYLIEPMFYVLMGYSFSLLDKKRKRERMAK